MFDLLQTINHLQDHMNSTLQGVGMELADADMAFATSYNGSADPTLVELTKAIRKESLEPRVKQTIADLREMGYTVELDMNYNGPRHYRLNLKQGLDVAKCYLMLRSIGQLGV